MNRFKVFSCVFMMLIANSALAGKKISCSFYKDMGASGSREAALTLYFDRGVLDGVDASSIVASGSEGGAYSCNLEIIKSTPDTHWETVGNTSKVWLGNDQDDEPNIKVIVKGKSTMVLMNIDPDSYCSFGASLPRKMTKTANGRCRVEF